jgi:hypothetical protein
MQGACVAPDLPTTKPSDADLAYESSPVPQPAADGADNPAMTKFITLTLVAVLAMTSLAASAPLSKIDAGSIAADVALADRYRHGLEDGTETNRGMAADQATMCIAGIQHVISDGVPTSATVEVAGATITLASALADHCQPLLDYAKQAGARATTALKQRLQKLGLKGDRLAFALARHANQDDVYLAGAKLVTSDAQYVTGAVFFVLGGGGRGERWMLTRFSFAGDRAVSTSTQSYLLRPGAAKFR